MAVLIKLIQNKEETLWGWVAKGLKKTQEVEYEKLEENKIFSEEFGGEMRVEPKFATRMEAVTDAKDSMEVEGIASRDITILPY